MRKRTLICWRGVCSVINGDPKALRAFHGWSVVFWAGVWIAGGIFGWLESVTFVSHLSAAALVLTSWAAWQAVRVEVKQDEAK